MAETQEILHQKIKEQGDLVRKLKATKESSEKAKDTKPGQRVSPNYDLQEIDTHLSEYSYLCGYTPGKLDIDIMKEIGDKVDFNKYKYVKRWWHHMRSFSDSEILMFPTNSPPNIRIFNKTPKATDQQVCE